MAAAAAALQAVLTHPDLVTAAKSRLLVRNGYGNLLAPGGWVTQVRYPQESASVRRNQQLPWTR